MISPGPSRTLWRLAIALWGAAVAAGVATLLLRGQRPPAMPSVSCTIDRTGAVRWFTARTGDEASASAPSRSEIEGIDAVAIEISLDAPSIAIVDALSACAREEPFAVALAAAEATSAAPTFMVIPPRTPDELALDAEPVAIAPVGDGMWSIETLAVATRAPALEVGPTLARLRGPGRAISAAQPIEIRCGMHSFTEVRDVLVGVLRDAPEARISLVGAPYP